MWQNAEKSPRVDKLHIGVINAQDSQASGPLCIDGERRGRKSW